METFLLSSLSYVKLFEVISNRVLWLVRSALDWGFDGNTTLRKIAR